MGNYATTSDVLARLPYRAAQITVSSSPSTSQVSAWVDEAEAMIDGELAAAQLGPVPYTATGAVRILKSKTCDYADGMVRRAFAGAGGDGANTDGVRELERFEAFLQLIRTDPLRVGAMLGAGASPGGAARARSHWTDTSDGAADAPVFTDSEVF